MELCQRYAAAYLAANPQGALTTVEEVLADPLCQAAMFEIGTAAALRALKPDQTLKEQALGSVALLVFVRRDMFHCWLSGDRGRVKHA